MGRRMRDYIHLDESEVKEWHCFKKEREICSLVKKIRPKTQRGKRVDGKIPKK